MSDRTTSTAAAHEQHGRMNRVFSSQVVFIMRGKDSGGVVVTWLDRGVPRLVRPGYSEICVLSRTAS